MMLEKDVGNLSELAKYADGGVHGKNQHDYRDDSLSF